MTPAEILEQARSEIKKHAGGDPDKWFYANRFVFARLMLDERKTKAGIKKRMIESGAKCHSCGIAFESKTGIHLHRLDQDRGYSYENSVLMHGPCHREFHAKKPAPQRSKGGSPTASGQAADAVLTKVSKRYDGSFLYWWDIAPGLRERLTDYEAVEFKKSDTGESCTIPAKELDMILTKERHTLRSKGNWGVKVFRDSPEMLSFEPGKGCKDWHAIEVEWDDPSDVEEETE